MRMVVAAASDNETELLQGQIEGAVNTGKPSYFSTTRGDPGIKIRKIVEY